MAIDVMRVTAVVALTLVAVQPDGCTAAVPAPPSAVAPGTVTVAADGIDERTGLPRLAVSATAPSELEAFVARQQPFCFDGFRMSAARALCRGQGYSRGAVIESEPVGPGWQPLNVWADCSENATRLDHHDCTFTTRSNASCDARANVICNVRDFFTIENCANGTATPTCAYGALQMRPGDERQAHPPHVDAVCADNMSPYNVAQTACRALGLVTNRAYIWGRWITNPKDTVVWPDGIACGPHGSDLLFGCRLWTYRYRSPTCLKFAILSCEWWHRYGDPDGSWIVVLTLALIGTLFLLCCFCNLGRGFVGWLERHRNLFARHGRHRVHRQNALRDDDAEAAAEATANDDDLLGAPLQPREALRPPNPLVPVEL